LHFFFTLKNRKKGTENSTDGRARIESIADLGTGDMGIAAVVSEAKKQETRYFFIEDESSRVIFQAHESIK
jgi:hypothetical protein